MQYVALSLCGPNSIMNKNKYIAIRNWSLILAVVPCSMLFIIGCMDIIKPISLLTTLSDFVPAVMKVDSLESYSTDPQGIRAVGKIDEEMRVVPLGTEADETLSPFYDSIAKHGTGTLDVYLNRKTDRVVVRRGRSLEQVKSDAISDMLRLAFFLITPFLILVCAAIYSHRKI